MRPLLAVAFLLVLSVFLLGQTYKVIGEKKLEVKGNKATAKTATYQLFPYLDTIEGLHPYQRSGCQCNPIKVIISPTAVTTPVNTPVQIRYDASPICWKQGITDTNGNPYPPMDQMGNLTLGNVQWEVGAASDLPHEYGIITYSGYAQPKTEQITVNIKLRCIDTPHNKFNGEEVCGGAGYNTCTATGTVPVTVH